MKGDFFFGYCILACTPYKHTAFESNWNPRDIWYSAAEYYTYWICINGVQHWNSIETLPHKHRQRVQNRSLDRNTVCAQHASMCMCADVNVIWFVRGTSLHALHAKVKWEENINIGVPHWHIMVLFFWPNGRFFNMYIIYIHLGFQIGNWINIVPAHSSKRPVPCSPFVGNILNSNHFGVFFSFFVINYTHIWFG